MMEQVRTAAIDRPEAVLSELTPKQREVLDLLIEHKTSKQISRILGISPHTVDQRINFARTKLGVSTRGEVALVYRRLLEIWEGSTYQESYLADPVLPLQVTSTNDPERLLIEKHPDRREPPERAAALPPPGRVLEFFDGRHGSLKRFAAIVCMTVVLIFLILGSLSIFASISEMIVR